MESTRVAAVVLAAGASSRLGRPKALLDFGGRPALARVLDALRAAGVTEGCIVTGEAHEALQDAVAAAPFPWIRNPAPAAGRLGSLQVGLRACAPGADILLWPVDRPLASAATVRALVHARETATPSSTIVPESGARRGHPFLLRDGLRDELLVAAPDANLRDVLAAHVATRVIVPVNDAGIHFDLDTEEDYRVALRWWEAWRP